MLAIANRLLLEFVEQHTVLEPGERKPYVALPVRCRVLLDRAAWRLRKCEEVEAPRERNRRALPLGRNVYGHQIVALIAKVQRMPSRSVLVEFVVEVRNSRPL